MFNLESRLARSTPETKLETTKGKKQIVYNMFRPPNQWFKTDAPVTNLRKDLAFEPDYEAQKRKNTEKFLSKNTTQCVSTAV
jgi:hypothetical protein